MKESRVAPIVLEGISKHFGGAKALQQASLTINSHEVHGLLGENGSGKSTLIKILAGFHTPDEGQIFANGERVSLPMPPGRPRELGIGFVHQDLGLIPSLTVLDNLRIGRFAARTSWRVSWNDELKTVRQQLGDYGLDVDPRATVESLRPTQRAMLAIIRAVEDIRSATTAPETQGLLVLDETTVFLPGEEKAHLFRVIREIARTSASVLFVSHDLDEVQEITDEITVLRDGKVQGTVSTSDATTSRLVEMIVGREVDFGPGHQDHEAHSEPSIVVEDLVMDGVEYPTLGTSPGEVLGLTGLPGTGFDRLPHALFGAKPAEGGTLFLDGTTIQLRQLNPAKAVMQGIGFMPGDRLREGSVGSLPVEDNVMQPVLQHYRTPLGLNRRAMTAATADLMERFDVRPRDPRKPITALSGGNQQKALVGKWLQLNMRLWLLQEPTQGVDIGARQQIFEEIRSAASGGMAVMIASNDHEQLSVLCDRVLVFGTNGRIGSISGAALTKRSIGAACFELVETRTNRSVEMG